MNIIAIYGSLREKSYNKALLAAAQKMAPEGMTIELMDPGAQFPLFNDDISSTAFPAIVTEYKQKIRAADGIIFSTPEYNRGISGVLKNMIDYCSRPHGEGVWGGGKPYGVLSASNGRLSGMAANYELKKILVYFGGHVMGQPEFFLGNSGDVFDEQMNLKDEKTKELLMQYLAAFKAHVAQVKK